MPSPPLPLTESDAAPACCVQVKVQRVAVERRRSVGGGSVGLAAMVEVEVVAAQKVAPCLLLSCVAQAGTRVRVEPGRNNFLAAGDTSN